MVKARFQELNELVQKLTTLVWQFLENVRASYSLCPLQIRLEFFAPSLVAFADGVIAMNTVLNNFVCDSAIAVFCSGAKRNPLIVYGHVLRNREGGFQ